MKSGRDGIEALQATLADLDRDIDRLVQVAAEVARQKSVPDLPEDAGDNSGVEAIAVAWDAACRKLAILIARVAAGVDDAMSPLEERPQPTGMERVKLGLRALLALQWRRTRPAPADALRAVLADADRLSGMLLPRRERLAAVRRSLEADLVELSSHRALLADNLAAAAEQEGRVLHGAAVLVERYLQTVQDLIRNLNAQLGAMNVLANKLTIEAERAILLIGIIVPRPHPAAAAPNLFGEERLPHLAPLVDLHEKDMLSSVEIERRKTVIDSRFSASFQDVLDNLPGADYVKGTNAEVGHA